jgi:hypothetical protein
MGLRDLNSVASAIRTRSVRPAIYWVATVLVAFELVASFIWVLVGTQYVTANLTRLGYPLYLASIIGFFDFPGAVTLLVPRFTRLKEWAYAGAFFKYSGALASHAFAGDGPDRWAAPLVFAILTVTSWALRPRERRMIPVAQAAETRAPEWVVPLLVIVGFVIISLLTVPA